MSCLQMFVRRAVISCKQRIKLNISHRFIPLAQTTKSCEANVSVFVFNSFRRSSKNTRFTGTGTVFAAGMLTWLGLQKEEVEKEDELISVIKLGILSLQKREYDKAETILHLALKLAQERQDMQAQRYVFDILANVAFEKGDLPKAEKLFVEVTKELLATGTSMDDNAVVNISLKLASIYCQQDQISKAEEGFRFCLSTQEKKVKSLNLSNVDSLSESEQDTVQLWGMSVDWYARFLLAIGRFKDAKENFEKAIDISEKINGLNHPQTLVLLNDLGSVASLQKDFDSAIKIFEKAIYRSSKSDSQDIPAFYCNLGATYYQVRDYTKGEAACRKALKLAKSMNNKDAQVDAEECLQDIKNARR